MKTFEEHLEKESAGWLADGLIDAGLRERLLARHPAKAERGSHRFLAILAGVGGVLFFVGISLVIKSNWEQIQDWVKIGGVVALLLASYGAGWRLKINPGQYPKTGDACLLVGAVLFLLGIALVSQIFHIDSRPSNGVLLWWAGIAAVPWLTRARGAQLVSVVGGLVWLGMEGMADDSWLRLSARETHAEGYLLASAGVLVGSALLLAGLGSRGGRRGIFAGLHEGAGLSVLCFSLYALGFTWSGDLWHARLFEAARWQPVVLFAGLLTTAAIWAARRNAGGVKPLAWSLALAGVPAVAHLLGFDLGDSGWAWGALACIALFVLNLGMIRAGLAAGRESWISLGIAGIALNVLTRYFVLFGTMLEGGLFFIVTGLIVLGLGFYLERKRRSLVSRVRKEASS